MTVLEAHPRPSVIYLERCACCQSLQSGSLLLDEVHGDVVVGAQRVHMPAQERIILRKLLRKRGAVVSPDDIIRELWGSRHDGGPDDAKRAVYVLVSKLRRKLRLVDASARIEMVGYRHGYRLTGAEG
jgi:DNA-binding response OmpR family regulator